MFDADTVNLMRSAPKLEGLDLEALPQRLTETYASIVAARIRVREEGGAPVSPVLSEMIEEMRRLAFSLEALVSIVPERQNRASAAFVAGAAHHVGVMAANLASKDRPPSMLGLQGISPAVSATLLFLIAEASADAAEMAKAIRVDTTDPVEAVLLRSIVHLARGELGQVLALPIPGAEQILVGEDGERAVRALYSELFNGVRELAATFLEAPEDYADEDLLAAEVPEAGPISRFVRVKELSVDRFDDLIEGNFPSLYPGPLHLASLLISVAGDMATSALVRISSPPGVDSERWSGLLEQIAKRRPYLWRNHREAVGAGYLEPGTSSAISFPTGAGKSTLSELKIAAALLRDKKVVFLAPTLALVDQTARALSATFPNADVQRERAEDIAFAFDDEALPEITVMTPERCLALLSFQESAFLDVGLLVFDECHLLHPRDANDSRRSIDAMLCLLNFNRVAPDADFLLLSAMMSNAIEMAGWIESLTSRPCLPLALTWKPTRQVRGCVVYGADDIAALKAEMAEVRASVTNIHAPVTLKRRLTAQPHGFFCLRQTWISNARSDYSLLPLLSEPVLLAAATSKDDGSWYLTPNGNQVAAHLAGPSAEKGIKTLVFVQTIPLANSATTMLEEALGEAGCALGKEELQLYDIAVSEAGGADHLYLRVGGNGVLLSSSACHHGLLMPAERNLHESLFRRPDGINVLVATSTLAQGMNLPSEVVIIAGDSRFDPAADKMARLEAHELLNAAGRAGRAGDGAYGFVLVVPSKVVDFNNTTSRIHNHWSDLKAIFAQSDQCLTIDDPFVAILDNIHSRSSADEPMARYLLQRLPRNEAADQDGPNAAATKLLGQSLAAYRARQRNDEAWVETRIRAVLTAREAALDPAQPVTWIERLAAAAGVQTEIIAELATPLASINRAADISAWRQWMTNWLKDRPALVPTLIRRVTLEGLLGSTYKKLTTDEARGRFALQKIEPLLELWVRGGTYVDLERAFGTAEHLLGRCEYAREFALRTVPELAYIYGLPAQIVRARWADEDSDAELPLALAMLGASVREGTDNYEKLALRQHLKGAISRVSLHGRFNQISPYLNARPAEESLGDATKRVASAASIHELLG